MLQPDLANPRLGVVSLFLGAGAGDDVLVSTMVLSLVSPTVQIEGTTAVFANMDLSPRLSPDPVKVCQHSLNYTKRGKDIGIKVYLTQRKSIYMIHTWVKFVRCILRTFGIHATSKQIYLWFPKLIKKGLRNPLI